MYYSNEKITKLATVSNKVKVRVINASTKNVDEIITSEPNITYAPVTMTSIINIIDNMIWRRFCLGLIYDGILVNSMYKLLGI